jgi:hypothetical protein
MAADSGKLAGVVVSMSEDSNSMTEQDDGQRPLQEDVALTVVAILILLLLLSQ